MITDEEFIGNMCAKDEKYDKIMEVWKEYRKRIKAGSNPNITRIRLVSKIYQIIEGE